MRLGRWVRAVYRASQALYMFMAFILGTMGTHWMILNRMTQSDLHFKRSLCLWCREKIIGGKLEAGKSFINLPNIYCSIIL